MSDLSIKEKSKKERYVFLDTNILILAIDSNHKTNIDAPQKKRIKRANKILKACVKTKHINLVINFLTMFEMLRLTHITEERINKILDILQDTESFSIWNITSEDALLASELLREINLNKEIKKQYDIEPLSLTVLNLLGLSNNIRAENMKEDSTITLKSSDKKTIALNINTIKNINENFVIDVFHFAFCKNNKLEYKTDNTKDFENINIAYTKYLSKK